MSLLDGRRIYTTVTLISKTGKDNPFLSTDSDRAHKNALSHSSFIFQTEKMVHLLIGEISEILANPDSNCETEIGSFSDYSLCKSDESEQE